MQREHLETEMKYRPLRPAPPLLSDLHLDTVSHCQVSGGEVRREVLVWDTNSGDAPDCSFRFRPRDGAEWIQSEQTSCIFYSGGALFKKNLER